jgi:hypothetical protein
VELHTLPEVEHDRLLVLDLPGFRQGDARIKLIAGIVRDEEVEHVFKEKVVAAAYASVRIERGGLEAIGNEKLAAGLRCPRGACRLSGWSGALLFVVIVTAANQA